MDGYAWVLEALRENGCQRLRTWSPDGRARFSTWLVVVARRLLLDRHRRRYGRPRSANPDRRAEHDTRRRLEDLVAAELEPEDVAASGASAPDAALRRRELGDALRRALHELMPADRLLLALRFQDERPVREIAAMMELPTVFHVYRRIGAALESLRRALARRGVEDAEP